MQTFKPQSTQSQDQADLPKAGGEYVPYVPSPVVEKAPQGDVSPISTPSQAFHENRETPFQVYQPEYTYIPPTQSGFTQEHWGMSREKFRTLILGLFGITFVIFLVIIIGFGGRDATYKAPRIPELNLVHPTPRQKIQFPLLVSGQAQTSWFFEGAFPVTLYDKNNIPVARDFARTNRDPRGATVPLLPFELTFKAFDYIPTPGKGYMVLQKGTGEGTIDSSGVVTIPIQFPKIKESEVVLKDQSIIITPETVDPDQDPNGIGTASFECSDKKDNDVDSFTDEKDNDCHTDLNAATPEGYDPYSNESRRGSGGYNPSDATPTDQGYVGNSFYNPTYQNSIQPLLVPNTYTSQNSAPINLYLPTVNYDGENSCNNYYTVSRTFNPNVSLESAVRTVLNQLFDAPTASESNQGYATALAPNLDIDSLTINNGVASIYLSESRIAQSGCSRIDATLQIQKTLLQFNALRDIRIYANGVLQ